MNRSLRLMIVLACIGSSAGVTWSTERLFSGSVPDYITPCPNEHSDFAVSLKFKGAGNYGTSCVRSYKRRPFDDESCLGNDDDWKAESGRSLEYLETQVSGMSDMLGLLIAGDAKLSSSFRCFMCQRIRPH